jgi:hypothetical protein
MGCCGQKRQAMKSPSTPGTKPASPQPRQTPRQPRSPHQPTPGLTGPTHSSVSLRYLERSPILVRGPATGREYSFSGTHPVQPVDARDAEAFLRTRFFRKIV